MIPGLAGRLPTRSRARSAIRILFAVVAFLLLLRVTDVFLDSTMPWLLPRHRARHSLAVDVAGIDPVLADLLVFHPSWITRLQSSHDPKGGNGDGFVERMPTEGDWRVLFHAVGEGRITRLWMTADSNVDVPKDYHELWIEADGRTIFRGHPYDFFYGKAGFTKPLVLGFPDSSWALLSLVPIPFLTEAKIRFRGNPHYYQVGYRQGAGSSEGPSVDEVARFLGTPWWHAPKDEQHGVASVDAPLVLARGPCIVTDLDLSVSPRALASLAVEIADQPPLPLPFLFGFSPPRALDDPTSMPWPTGTSALHASDESTHRLETRMPIPLHAGQTLTLRPRAGTEDVAFGVERIDGASLLASGVGLIVDPRVQRAPREETTAPVFVGTGALQLVSFVEDIASEIPGNRGFLEGDEMIRLDQMAYPLFLGTGTEDYYDGGWYFQGPHENPISGLSRLRVVPQGGSMVDDWGKANFEYVMYRHHVLDPIVARSGMRFGFEVGETGAYGEATVSSVAFAYGFPHVRELARRHVDVTPDAWVTSANDAEKNEVPRTFPVRKHKPTRLVVPCVPGAPIDGVLLVRTYDAAEPGQRAWISVDGRVVSETYEFAGNESRRLAQDSVFVDLFDDDCVDRPDGAAITIDVEPRPHAPWNESAWDVVLYQFAD